MQWLSGYEKNIQLRLEIGHSFAIVGFYDTELANEIIANLPLELKMQAFGGREYCGEELPFVPKSHEENQTYFEVGDFAYWGKGNALAFFFAEGMGRDVPSGIVVIGKILSDLSEIKQMPQNIVAKLEEM